MRNRRREGTGISPTQTHAIPTPRDAGHRKGGRGQHRSGSDVRCAPRDATGSKCTGHFDTASFTRHDADHGSFATIYVEYGSSQGPVFTRVTPGTHAGGLSRQPLACSCTLAHATLQQIARLAIGDNRPHSLRYLSPQTSAAPIEDPWRAAAAGRDTGPRWSRSPSGSIYQEPEGRRPTPCTSVCHASRDTTGGHASATRATHTPSIRFPHMRNRRREGTGISPTQTHPIPSPRDAGHRKGGRGQRRSGSAGGGAPRDVADPRCTGHSDTTSFTRHDADHGSFATIYVEYGSSQGPVFTRVTPARMRAGCRGNRLLAPAPSHMLPCSRLLAWLSETTGHTPFDTCLHKRAQRPSRTHGGRPAGRGSSLV
ncbi:MAG: hypothetical protein WDW36_010190 [Sanguina aurantia]